MATTAKAVSDALTRAGLRNRVDHIENNLATLGEVVMWRDGAGIPVYAIREALAEIRKDSAAVSLGRRGGQATSKAKAASARENGKRGGRPKKP